MIVIHQMKVYWQFILLLLLLPDVRSWTNVTDCPYSEDEWKNRSMSYNCHLGGFKYHCLKTTSGHLVEKCHPRRGLREKDGCPIFAFRNSSYRITQTSCTGPPQGCPRRNKTFLSYEIYKFPSCLPPRFDRSMSVALDTYTSIQYYRETTVDPESTTQLDATKPTSHVQHETTNKDFPLTVTKQKSEVSFIGENLLYIAVGGTVIIIIIVGFICLVLVQCKRIRQFKFQMERANYMSSVPYNSHATHIYHQDTDIYDYVDETDMKDDEENAVQSDKLRQNIDVDIESDANVEPNRPDRESKELNEILHMYIPMRNAPMNCSSSNIVCQDTYLEPNVGVLAARVKNDNVEVSESDGNTPSQNGRVCIKLTRLVSNDSYVEPCMGQISSSNKDLVCNVKEETKRIKEDGLRSEELYLRDLNLGLHNDDARSCINTSFKGSDYLVETVSDLNISVKVESGQTESTLNDPGRRNENIIISREQKEKENSQSRIPKDDDYIDPI